MAYETTRRDGRRFTGATVLVVSASLVFAVSRGHVGSRAWVPPQQHSRPAADSAQASGTTAGRRAALELLTLAGVVGSASEPAWASGGSTAGKFTTIPTAKRRFYGRVRQGIFEYLQMGEAIQAGNLKDPRVSRFFDKNLLLQAGGEKVRKGCNPDLDPNCLTVEKKTSRWLDFKASSYLLASAFRYDANEVNDFLPQVKMIKSYQKNVEAIQKAAKSGDVQKAKDAYKNSFEPLEKYLVIVELNPISSGDYSHEWDTTGQVLCTGFSCLG